MENQNESPPSGEASDQQGSSTAANPPTNLPFGAGGTIAVDQTAIPQILNPYAAAAAAIALANQQMAQSFQANAMGFFQQPNGAFRQPTITNSGAQSQGPSADAPPSNSAASFSSQDSAINSSSQNGQNVAQAGAANAVQNAPFPFPTQTPLAALFAGGWLTAGNTNQAPPVTLAPQQNNVQQQQANNNVFHKSAAASKASVPKAAPKSTEAPPAQSTPHASAAMAAAQVVAAHHAAAASSSVMTNAAFAHMQNWKLDQLGTFSAGLHSFLFLRRTALTHLHFAFPSHRVARPTTTR